VTADFSVFWWHHYGAMVVVPVGPLDVRTYGRMRDALVKAAADAPRAVIVELDQLEVRATAALAVFPAAAAELATWPRVPLLLVASGGVNRQVLADYRMSRYIAVHRGIDEALAAAGDPPPRRVARADLPNGSTSFHLARTFVREHCQRWEIAEERTIDAVCIANELVENTIKHTYGPPTIRVELRRDVLTVAVYDDDPASPQPATASGKEGRAVGGLALIARMSRTWGCSPTQSGGKVVWVVL
jgi:anti-sigma regulatory factor (Ser/Thr protein kinase)/anti-anti-sigma regulatory factor